VGGQNYQLFFRLIASVFAMTLLHTATDIAVLVCTNQFKQEVIEGNQRVREAFLTWV
jgi:hypothetical protein